MRVRDIMRRRVARAQPDETMADLIRLLVRESISGAPVVDDKGHLVGVVSMRDVLGKIASALESNRESLDSLLATRRVKEIMTPLVYAVAPETSISELATTLRREGVHRAFVLEDGRLCGVVSTYDVLRAAAVSS
jgi:CBS domain-containing protein